MAELPVLAFAGAAEFEAWLHQHHATSPGVTLKIAKKASGIDSVTIDEALEIVLCYGWIDGRRNALDEDWYLQRYTPRRARSNWSKRNCGIVERLVDRGRMRPPGLAEVERAKADGRWDAAYDSHRTATVPDDLQVELDRHPEAAAFFAALNRANRYAILYRIQDAKKPETRARRITQSVAMLDEHKKLIP